MNDCLKLDYDFAERWAKNARAEHLRVYIYILCQFQRLGKMLSVDEVADGLNLDKKTTKSAFDFWIAVGVLKCDNKGRYSFTGHGRNEKSDAITQNEQSRPTLNAGERPNYSTDDINEAIDRDASLNFLYKQAQILLGKTLSNLDIQILYSFYDYYGFPVEVIVMLLSYAVGKDKKAMRYIEKIAMDWADKGINTVDDAESYIKKMELRDSKENKIRSILGIDDRKPTDSEKKYIRGWIEELKVSLDLIPLAYERTVAGTGKLSMAYMDKIMQNWAEHGIKTTEQLEKFEQEYKNNKAEKQKDDIPARKTKFNNFGTKSGEDYGAIAQKMIEDLLG